MQTTYDEQPDNQDTSLHATISLLKHTSHIVKLFNDKLPISSLNDPRLKQLKMNFTILCLSGEKKPRRITVISYHQSCGLIWSQCVLVLYQWLLLS